MDMIKRFRLASESSESQFIPSDTPKLPSSKQHQYREQITNAMLGDLEGRLVWINKNRAVISKRQLEELEGKVRCLEASNEYMEVELRRLEASRDIEIAKMESGSAHQP